MVRIVASLSEARVERWVGAGMIIESVRPLIWIDPGQNYILFPGLVLRLMILSPTSCLLRKQVDLEDIIASRR